MEIRWSPIQDRFILWHGDTIASYQVVPRSDRPYNVAAFNISNTHCAELIFSAGSLHHVKCFDLYPHSQGDEIIALGGSSKVSIAYMAKLAWDGRGLPRNDFSAKYPRQCTSVQFNPVDSHWLAVGLEKYKPDNCLLIFDVTQVVCKREYNQAFVTSSEVARPVFEFGMAEHCQNLSWFHNNCKILAAGMNMKYVRLFDVRDPTRIVSCTVTKAALGVCTNPRDDKYLASHFDNLVYIWDTRNIEKPLQILTQSKTVGQISWCPSKGNLLSVLQKDSTSVTLFDVQHPTVGSEEVEPTIIERCVNLKTGVGSFSWHPNDENRILSCALQSQGRINISDHLIHDRVALNITPDLQLVWTYGKKVLKSLNLRKLPNFEDVSLKILQRAKAKYGLQEDLYKHSDQVKEDEILSNVWNWLHLSAKLVEDNKVVAHKSTKHPGVLSVINSSDSEASDVVTKLWSDLMQNNCKGSVKYYTRSDRTQALLLCSWPLYSDPPNVITFVQNLEREGAYSRAAAIAVFNLQIPLAIEVLNRAPVEAGLSYVGIALAGFSNEEESNWKKFCTNALKKISDPYLKVMFSFLLNPGNYDCVLKEPEMIVDDRVGFALLYLPDLKLLDYLLKLSGELCDKGHLDGLLLTGNNAQGLKLLQKYLDETADIQSTTLIAVRAFSHELDSPQVKNWIWNYQELLNRWKFWFERADFDLMLIKEKNERPSPQIYMSCTYCGKNISAHLRSLKNQQFSRISVSGATNKLTGCPHCRKPLSRCIICLMTMGSPIVENTDKSQAFDNWFTWCQSCRHGGHSKHITNWFMEHLECPMVGCSCKCYSLDFTTPARHLLEKVKYC